MIQKAMMNLLIKAMKTVLPANKSTSNSSSQNAKQIDIHNITDRATLEAVINSNNYSEIDKIAYNSAVANGVIPQGNVMEGLQVKLMQVHYAWKVVKKNLFMISLTSLQKKKT